MAWFSYLFIFPLISSQITTYPRDEPIIYSSNHVSKCCEQFFPNKASHSFENQNKSRYQNLFNCVDETTSSFSFSKDLPSPSSAKISIVSYLTPNILQYGTLSAAINSIYSSHHSYQFKILSPSTGDEHFPEDQRWNKVKILENAINHQTGWAKDCDYIVWLDSDLIFLDLGMNIEEIYQLYPTYHVIMSEDVDLSLGIANTGFVLVKNSQWSFNFLSSWWNNYNKSQGMDQWVLSKLYEDNKEEYQHYIKLLPVDAVNTNFPSWKNQLPHNQILHLAGANKQIREQAFFHAFSNICSNINDISSSNTCEESEGGRKIIPRQLGLSREVLAGLDSSLPRAQILNKTLQKIKLLDETNFIATQVIELLTELREDWTMHTHRHEISGGLDPDHDEKLLWGYKKLAAMLLKNLDNNSNSPSRFADIQAYLNTIYFIITEMSSSSSSPSSGSSTTTATVSHSTTLIHDLIALLLSSFPLLNELLHSSSQLPIYSNILIYEYKFYKYLIALYMELEDTSKILLYYYQLNDVWSRVINNNYLETVLSIEETNMNPLYNPYHEMQYDLDSLGYYYCNLSYYDHLVYDKNIQLQKLQQHSQHSQELDNQEDSSSFDDIHFSEMKPINQIEKELLTRIYQTFPKKLSQRVQIGLDSIEKSIKYYNSIWPSRDYQPSEILFQHIQRLLTLSSCFYLTIPSLESNLINTQLTTIHTTLTSTATHLAMIPTHETTANPTYFKLQTTFNLLTELHQNYLLRNGESTSGENDKKGRVNRMARRKGVK